MELNTPKKQICYFNHFTVKDNFTFIATIDLKFEFIIVIKGYLIMKFYLTAITILVIYLNLVSFFLKISHDQMCFNYLLYRLLRSYNHFVIYCPCYNINLLLVASYCLVVLLYSQVKRWKFLFNFGFNFMKTIIS